MIKNFGKIKTLLIIIILFSSILVVSTPITPAKKSRNNLFGFSHFVEIEWKDIVNASIPIKPYEETRTYTLIINYALTKGPFGDLIYKWFYSGKRVDIKLEIVSYPEEFSTVALPDNTISFGLPNSPYEELDFERSIVISIDDDAPAYKECPINMKVIVPRVGMIKEFECNFTLSFIPDYAPLLDVIPEISNELLIKPYNETKIPIRITNDGNGRTRVLLKIENISETWNPYLPDNIILEPDQTTIIDLTFTPDHKFDEKEVIITYAPAWAENTDIKGAPQELSLFFINDGSYKEDDNGILMMFFILVIIVIAILGSIILISKRKK